MTSIARSQVIKDFQYIKIREVFISCIEIERHPSTWDAGLLQFLRL